MTRAVHKEYGTEISVKRSAGKRGHCENKIQTLMEEESSGEVSLGSSGKKDKRERIMDFGSSERRQSYRGQWPNSAFTSALLPLLISRTAHTKETGLACNFGASFFKYILKTT